MNTFEFTLVVGICALLAGLLGALTGLGGGVVLTPVLTLALGVDLRYAIGASLIAAIATSSGAAIAYVREGYTNMRVGMFLEVATTFGAVTGALIAAKTPINALALIFGIVMLSSAYLTNQPHRAPIENLPVNPLAARLNLDSHYPTRAEERLYHVQNVPGGFALMLMAGMISGLLGIGSGSLKVLAMDQAMKLPFKVSTTTSNFMIGVTAAASAGVYFSKGYVDPGLCMPILLGVLMGAWAGAKLLVDAKTALLRFIFSLIILAIGMEMIYKGITGGL